MTLAERVAWLGGTLTEHSEGGWVVYLSPRLAQRLAGPGRGPIWPLSTRVNDEAGLLDLDHPLVVELDALYETEVNAIRQP